MKKLFDILLVVVTIAVIIVLFFCGEEGISILAYVGVVFGIGTAVTLYVVR